MNNMFKNLAIWMVIGVVLMTVFNQFNTRQAAMAQLDYSEFLQGRTLEATPNEGKRVVTYAPSDLWMVSDLLKHDVKVIAKPDEEQSFLMSIFVSWFPMLLLIGVWVFFMRQMQGGGKGGAFSFGKSRARMTDEATNTTTFADVAGCDEAKEEVSELVDFLRDPSKFQKLILSRCSWAWALRACATCLNRPRSRHPALSLSMSLTRSDANVVPVWAAAMTSASRP